MTTGQLDECKHPVVFQCEERWLCAVCVCGGALKYLGLPGEDYGDG